MQRIGAVTFATTVIASGITVAANAANDAQSNLLPCAPAVGMSSRHHGISTQPGHDIICQEMNRASQRLAKQQLEQEVAKRDKAKQHNGQPSKNQWKQPNGQPSKNQWKQPNGQQPGTGLIAGIPDQQSNSGQTDQQSNSGQTDQQSNSGQTDQQSNSVGQ